MLKLYIFFQESNPEVRNHGKIAFFGYEEYIFRFDMCAFLVFYDKMNTRSI